MKASSSDLNRLYWQVQSAADYARDLGEYSIAEDLEVQACKAHFRYRLALQLEEAQQMQEARTTWVYVCKRSPDAEGSAIGITCDQDYAMEMLTEGALVMQFSTEKKARKVYNGWKSPIVWDGTALTTGN